MMVKHVIKKFHKHHLGVKVCLNVCVHGFIQDFAYVGRGLTPKFGVDMEGV